MWQTTLVLLALWAHRAVDERAIEIVRGAMGAVGECYHGSDPVWYSEFRRNSMVRSDGECPRMHAKVGLHAA